MDLLRRRLMIQGGGEPPIIPVDDGYIWALYDVDTLEAETILTKNTTGITGPMLVDGNEVTLAAAYQFPSLGKHWVKFKFSGNKIPNSQFQQITRLSEIYFPSNVHEYGNYNIDQCPILRKIHFFGDVTSISTYYCFMRFQVLEEVNLERFKVNATNNSGNFTDHKLQGRFVIPEGVTRPPSLATNSFSYAKTSSLILPSTMTTLPPYMGNFWSSLRYVTCYAVNPPTGNFNILASSGITNIYVPAESVEAYKTASRWSQYASIISAIIE